MNSENPLQSTIRLGLKRGSSFSYIGERTGLLRRLHGITYWVLDNPDDIYDFVNTNIRKEWEEDARSEGRNPSEDPWLLSLSKRRWRLEILDRARIRLNPDIVNFVDPKRAYGFADSLAKRSGELRKVIEVYAAVIWPVIVKEENMKLADGYCRLSVLREMRIPRVYGYVGVL